MRSFYLVLFCLLAGNLEAKFKTVNNGFSACVLDKKNQLLWEVKTQRSGLHNGRNRYTWFDGETGVKNGENSHSCNWGANCNTQAYLKILNNIKFCNRNNWRLPSEQELESLLKYSDNNPLIDTDFFPNTQSKSYWSADIINQEVAIDVPFFYGGGRGSDKSFNAYIRAVSDEN
jgi:hypothetical protein